MGILFSIVYGGEELLTGEILTYMGGVWITGLRFEYVFKVTVVGLIYFIFNLISEFSILLFDLGTASFLFNIQFISFSYLS